ncbi:MAG: DUF58 domain-containing protein [Mariprofundaceae bacterium]|nr:DUF58 domain-containing protein [Mariprofundaceae bacterium]
MEKDIFSVSIQSLCRLSVVAKSLTLLPTHIRSSQNGQYISPFKGRGMEFDDVRLYQQGDDIRHLDWRITARTGKAHSKLFREERCRPVLLCVDYRQPMFFATRGAFKAVQAAHMASLFAWAALGQSDQIGGVIFSETRHDEVRPQLGRKAAMHLLKRLSDAHYWAEDRQTFSPEQSSQALQEALNRLYRVAHVGSLLVIVSDFRHMTEMAFKHLSLLARHHDVIIVFMYDELEKTLPERGFLQASDGVNQVSFDCARLHQAHATAFEQRYEHMKTFCQRHRLFFLACASDDDVLTLLQKHLRHRR